MNALALGPENPFPGLRPFSRADADWFFGRDEQSYRLYRLIDRGRFVAIVGGSGSGKSSIVRAGLLKLLDQETRESGGRNWVWWIARPGRSPLDHLAEALASPPCDTSRSPNPATVAETRAMLGMSSFGLADALRSRLFEQSQTPLIVIDQFEELFRFSDLPGSDTHRARRREEAAHMVQLLIEAANDSSLACRIVVTMRSDYLGDCATFAGLPEAMTTNQFLVPNLNLRQLEESIRGPISRAGAEISSRLVQRLLEDATGALDKLPILAHCMMQVWRRWYGLQGDAPDFDHRIREEDYHAIGGLRGAISQHAEEITAEPDMAKRMSTVESVFRALTELDRGMGVRRALSFARLAAETGETLEDIAFVVDRLRASRCAFLVPARGSLTSQTVVDIAHEALIQNWNRIGGRSSDDPSVDASGLDERAIGWVWQEAKDGERFQALSTLVEDAGEASDWVLPLDQISDRLEWWNARPRTPAWAERYVNEPGGRLEGVEKMFARSLDALSREAERIEAVARKKEQDEVVQRVRLVWQQTIDPFEIWDRYCIARMFMAAAASEDTSRGPRETSGPDLAEAAGIDLDTALSLLRRVSIDGAFLDLQGQTVSFPFPAMRGFASEWATAFFGEQPFGCFVDLRGREVMGLYGGGYVLGRRLQANLSDMAISRVHMAVLLNWENNLPEACDLRSLNGTTVNAVPLEYGFDRPLNSGDVVILASSAPLVFVGHEDFKDLAGHDDRAEPAAIWGVPRFSDIGKIRGYVTSAEGLTRLYDGDILDIDANGNCWPILDAEAPAEGLVRVAATAPDSLSVGMLEPDILITHMTEKGREWFELGADVHFDIPAEPKSPTNMPSIAHLGIKSTLVQIIAAPGAPAS